ncbi:MAG: UDP-N-acetylenolpyruvoylglucosamine reductase, partial [Patescibacteria group bacterium]
PHFVEPDDRIKVALGWILDKLCDAKGLVMGNVGTYENQALVIIAKPGATAKEVIDFSRELIKRVKDKTGIDIEGEVEWVC